MANKTIGIVGLGSIGARHARNLMRMGCIVHGFDPIETSEQPAEIIRHGTVEGLIEASDATIIASPSDDHAFQILAAPAGKPLFVEKPIGVSSSDAIEIAATLRHNKNTVMVGYNLRFHSCVKKAKEWLDAGLIGEPLWANFTCAQFNDKPAYLRDGVILNWSHEIDLALYLLGSGSVTGCSARLSDGRDDLADILLTHKSGCRTSIHLDYLTEPEIRRLFIIGTAGTVGCNLNTRYTWINSKNLLDAKNFNGTDSFDENYIEEMQAFLDRLDGKQTIGCTGEEGLNVLAICLEARRQAGL